MMVPPLLALSVMFALPLIVLVSDSGEAVSPLFRRTRLKAPKDQAPVLMTGVAASAAKLMPALFTELVKSLGREIGAPPEASSGAKPAMPILMGPLPKDEPLLKWIRVDVEAR